MNIDRNRARDLIAGNQIDRNSLAHKRALVLAAALDELPAMYEEIIGYDPTYDDHDEQPSETMRTVLLGYLDECMVEDMHAASETVTETPVRIPLDSTAPIVKVPTPPQGLTLDTPNLDNCEDDELEAWRKAFSDLALICAYMQEARDLRRSGLLSRAQPLEERADTLHSRLPSGVRW
jgi:hypothetical protein